MVAGRRHRSEYEQRSGQHQRRRGGELGVEAVAQDGGGAGELRGLSALVEPGRHVDQERDGEAERPKREDDRPHPRRRAENGARSGEIGPWA
jgi:hypothetical protein